MHDKIRYKLEVPYAAGAVFPTVFHDDEVIEKISQISELVGHITAWQDMNANPKLRRESRIKTIHSTLAIENNSLSLDQVTAIINGKRILGEPREIQEVKNAYEAYERLLSFDPYSVSDLLTAHRTLMNELVREAGMFRSGGVGVYKGEHLVHMAPPAGMVPELIESLFAWAKTSKVHPLVKSCVFHYEFEFILAGFGVIPVIWAALTVAPFLSEGLAGIVEGFTSGMRNPVKVTWCADSLKAICIFLVIYGMSLGVYYSTHRNYRKGEEHGSAKWSNARRTCKKYAENDRHRNLILTKNVRIGLDGRMHRRNLNVLVVGGSGAGKTRFYAKPNIMQANTSYVVLDPKGNVADARAYFNRVGSELAVYLSRLGSKCEELDAMERLALIHNFFRPDEESDSYFDINDVAKKGHSFRDYICPDTFEMERDCFRFGDRCGRVVFLRDYANYIKDDMITELCDIGASMMLSLDFIPIPTDETVREVESRLLGVETNIANWQRRQNQNNNF